MADGISILRLAISRRAGYIAVMASRTATKPTRNKRRRTTQVPVTTMEEIPVLSEQERAELLTSLEAAQARIKAGKGIDYDPKAFKSRLAGIYRRTSTSS